MKKLGDRRDIEERMQRRERSLDGWYQSSWACAFLAALLIFFGFEIEYLLDIPKKTVGQCAGVFFVVIAPFTKNIAIDFLRTAVVALFLLLMGSLILSIVLSVFLKVQQEYFLSLAMPLSFLIAVGLGIRRQRMKP